MGREEALPSRWHYVPVDPRWSWRALPGKVTTSPPAQESWAQGSGKSGGSSWSVWEGESCTSLKGTAGAQTCSSHLESTAMVLSLKLKKNLKIEDLGGPTWGKAI